MNTNIDDYSNDDIISLLRITKEKSHNEKIVRKQIKSVINEIELSDNYTPNEQNDLTNFFRKCYLRLGVTRKFPITDEIREELRLDEIETKTKEDEIPITKKIEKNNAETTIKEATEVNTAETRSRIVSRIPYDDSVPQPIPMDKTIRTVNTKYALGNINPIERETIKHILMLNSKFRTNQNNASYSKSQSDLVRIKTMHRSNNYKLCRKLTNIKGCETVKSGDIGTVTDFTVELTTPYRDVIAMKVAALTFDNFYYPISEYLGSNKITLTGFYYDSQSTNPASTIAGQVTETITIGDGYYGIEELIVEINSLLLASSNNAIKAIQIYHDVIKNKIVFRTNSSPPNNPPNGNGNEWGFNISFVHPDYPNRPLYMNFGWLLGFRESAYDYFTEYNTTLTPSLLVGFNSEGCANIFGTSNFFLEINDFNNNHPRVIDYNCTAPSAHNMTNLLTRVPNVTPFATQAYEDSSDRIFKKREYFGPVNISKIRIRMLDDNGVPVNMNEGCFTLTLEIETLTKSTKNMIL